MPDGGRIIICSFWLRGMGKDRRGASRLPVVPVRYVRRTALLISFHLPLTMYVVGLVPSNNYKEFGQPRGSKVCKQG